MNDTLPPRRRPAAPLNQNPTTQTLPSEDSVPPDNLVPDAPEAPQRESDREELQETPKVKKRRLAKWTTLSKKKKIAFIIVLILVLAGFGAAGWAYKASHSKSVVNTVEKKPVANEETPPAPTTEASRLTGLQVSPELNKRPVTGVMIENSPDARPQSGLINAGVVYEAVAEGGITRFLALFLEAKPDYIGPIRSSRPYYLDWLLPFDASYAHVGGSPEALAAIKSLGVKDLDQFANGSYYQRVSNRYAPHNVYTSMAKLDELNAKKGYTSSTFTSFPRKAEEASKTPTASKIDFGISSFTYNPHYDYDAATNSYKRSMMSKPHTDEKSGLQLSPKVVVALVINKSLQADNLHSSYDTSGTGQMFVFQDGTVTKGTWSKADHKAQYVFKNEAGGELKLNPGQTWISIVDKASAVTYTP